MQTRLLHPLLPWRQIIPWLVTRYLLRTVRIEAGSSGAGVPCTGRFVCAFAPHCGWIDSIVIDECFHRAGRAWPTWLTKTENRDLPGVLAAGRVICMDQECPEPSARVHFLPLYREHLGVDGPLRGKALGAQARLHTSRLREAHIAQIREIVPDYPVLGV